jgi:uncharacterized membrane protein YuzA (DUF378 family)
MNKLVFNILIAIACIGAFNWLLAANGKNLVTMISSDDSVVKGIYNAIGVAGLALGAFYVYNVFYLKRGLGDVCSM